MGRGPLFDAGFRPQFSGHETFPIRYGWLKKTYDAVAQRSSDPQNKDIFLADEAIGKFGVGKNMVSSMRYWAIATRTIEDESNGKFKGPYRATPFGRALFSDDGWDPFLEEPASLWWLHWQLAANPRPTTTIYFVFNHFHASSFYREQLSSEIRKYCEAIGYTDLADFTIKRDTDCFIRTYVSRGDESEEDALESLMSELGLLQPIGKRDGFLISRGPKPSLPNEVFFYGLVQFALSRPTATSFNVETLANEPGSPGRVFLLDEDSLLDRLAAIEDISRGQVTWSETAGLRQIFFKVNPSTINLVKIVERAYPRRRRAA
jgi:hypothetical protein